MDVVRSTEEEGCVESDSGPRGRESEENFGIEYWGVDSDLPGCGQGRSSRRRPFLSSLRVVPPSPNG